MRLLPSSTDTPSLSKPAVNLVSASTIIVDKTDHKARRIPLLRTAGVEETHDTDEQVKRFRDWLTIRARTEDPMRRDRLMNAYQEAASKPVTIHGRELKPYAPYRPQFSASETLTSWQIGSLLVLVLGMIVGLVVLGSNLLVGLIAAVTAFYLLDLVLQAALAVRTLNRSPAAHIAEATVKALANATWPRYTVLCPLHGEAAIVPQFVGAMQGLDYPQDRLQVLLLVEENDSATQEALRSQNLPCNFEMLVVPRGEPQTKPRACNYGLLHATGDYVVIYDAEDVPDPLQLKQAVLTFANMDEDIVCVQAKLNFYNPAQNALTRWFAAEYSLWFDLTLPGLQKAGFVLPLGGTSNHFKTAALWEVGGWDTFNVTEDCDLGLRLAQFQYKTAMLDSTTYEEATSQVKNWLRQRSRWIKGYMQTYLVYMRRPWSYVRRRGGPRDFLSLQLIVGGKTAVLFINPVMWVLVAIYIVLRPLVADYYRVLYPTPIFYMGVLCLVIGNFFYIYTHLLGSFQRRDYGVIKWVLLIPLYWALTSAAAFMALYQLVRKPHHWEKTNHGMHLKARARGWWHWLLGLVRRRSAQKSAPEAAEQTMTYYVASRRAPHVAPAVARKAKRDPWHVATILAAAVASVMAAIYFVSGDLHLVYGDAYAHMLIARRVLDNATPGLAQLGGIWLPLPHLLMAPFTWNDWLWRTGLAGSLPSMICYLVAANYVFLIARRLTHNGAISFVGALAFILNPNVLYLQVTPLSETVLMATMAMACYYFLAWVQDRTAIYLVLTAATTMLATLARYDGWSLFLVIVVVMVIIELFLRRSGWSRSEGTGLAFATFGGLGIGLWFLWCSVIFGDPLYFERSQFSSQTMQKTLRDAHILFTYHNVGTATSYFTLDTLISVGPLVVLLAGLGLSVFLWGLIRRRRDASESLAGLICLVPFPFYIYSLYTGQAAMYLPQLVPSDAPYHLYNVRYGAQLVAASAIFIAVLVAALTSRVHVGWLKGLLQVGVGAVIVGQSALTFSGGIISLQDGQFGLDCAPYHAIVVYMAQHYNGGHVLMDVYSSKIDSLESTAGIPFRDIVYEGSGAYWNAALRDPESQAQWVIVNPSDPNDEVAKHLSTTSQAFTQDYQLMLTEPAGLELFHRTDGAPLPSRQISSADASAHQLCGPFGAGRGADPALAAVPGGGLDSLAHKYPFASAVVSHPTAQLHAPKLTKRAATHLLLVFSQHLTSRWTSGGAFA
jgi:cellulose synthase/poly-beta-1,6-N-acetylglucosamine synthase-like glycosyltransferase